VTGQNRRASRLLAAALVPAAALALAACGSEREPSLPPEVGATAIPRPTPRPTASVVARGEATPGAEEARGEPTPLRERVATLGLLNKRNNLTREIKLQPGQSQRLDNVIVKVDSCERTPPWEDPPETGAFVQVFVEERATVRERLAWRKVFSGWLFKSSPSLNVVEHPVYDVWVKDCAMNFPGEEASPASSASASKAAKPAGRAAPKSAPSPRPSPRPAPAASPSPATTPA
jgi:hypothetical protein